MAGLEGVPFIFAFSSPKIKLPPTRGFVKGFLPAIRIQQAGFRAWRAPWAAVIPAFAGMTSALEGLHAK
jgi:hypothetical protein